MIFGKFHWEKILILTLPMLWGTLYWCFTYFYNFLILQWPDICLLKDHTWFNLEVQKFILVQKTLWRIFVLFLKADLVLYYPVWFNISGIGPRVLHFKTSMPEECEWVYNDGSLSGHYQIKRILFKVVFLILDQDGRVRR